MCSDPSNATYENTRRVTGVKIVQKCKLLAKHRGGFCGGKFQDLVQLERSGAALQLAKTSAWIDHRNLY